MMRGIYSVKHVGEVKLQFRSFVTSALDGDGSIIPLQRGTVGCLLFAVQVYGRKRCQLTVVDGSGSCFGSRHCVEYLVFDGNHCENFNGLQNKEFLVSFYGAVTISDCIAPVLGRLMEGELQVIQKEPIVA